MKILKLLLLTVLFVGVASCSKDDPTGVDDNSIYKFKVESIRGGTIDFSAFKGKKILVVNTASQCKYTYQYPDLQTLYEQNQGELVVVGFPCNDFGEQAPGGDGDIADNCEQNYGVTFPMGSKVSIVENTAPIFQWLTQKEQNGVMNVEVKWNFTKFLIDENGHLIASFPSEIEPLGPEIAEALKK